MTMSQSVHRTFFASVRCTNCCQQTTVARQTTTPNRDNTKSRQHQIEHLRRWAGIYVNVVDVSILDLLVKAVLLLTNRRHAANLLGFGLDVIANRRLFCRIGGFSFVRQKLLHRTVHSIGIHESATFRRGLRTRRS